MVTEGNRSEIGSGSPLFPRRKGGDALPALLTLLLSLMVYVDSRY
jgi:hypothetical protein